MGRHTYSLYHEIPILDAARRCGLVLNDRTLEWEEVEASCPFCGDHGPGKYHLSLNTRKNVYRCNLCNASGNSVSLYAQMESISNRQAYRALSEEGRLYRFPEQPLSKKTPEREPSSLAARHDTYYDMLSHLELSPKHRADLLARGLSEERIAQNMYRTLPAGNGPRRFLAGMLSDFHDLDGIPGFYVDDKDYWNIAGHGGLLVPYCDKDGYIQGMQIRLDDEQKPNRKYRWLSSRTRKFGTRSRSWIHVTGNTQAKTAYLTEGALKGDVASFLDHDALFVCFAGVNAIDGLEEVLRSLPISEVVMALDMDKLVNRRVRDALEKITELVQAIPGVHIRLMSWNATFKGVDNFYQARNYAAGKGVNILDMRSNFITRYLDNLWKTQYPNQDRGFIHTCEWEELTVPLDQLDCEKPEDQERDEVEGLKRQLLSGQTGFPPLACVNRMVIEGQNLFRAYRELGYPEVRIYQNVPWALPAAA